MTDRDRLIEAMAQALCADCGVDWERVPKRIWLNNARAALDTAERLGWRIVPPEGER